MNNIIKGFFFDLDGTLVDTHRANSLSYKAAIKEVYSVSPAEEELQARIKTGESSDVFLRALLPNINDTDVNAINSAKKKHYPLHLKSTVLNEFLSVFLAQMSIHYVTVLVTTAKRENALAVIKEHNLEDYFTHCIFGEDVTNMKPHPEAYFLALEKTGLKSNEVVAFEDSKKGIAAATGASISVIKIKDFL